RTPLSRVKGGGLRAVAPRARFVTLVLSDVLSNDPRVIASGPTIPSTPDAAAALGLLERYGIAGAVPAGVIEALVELAGSAPAAVPAAGDVLAFAGDNDRAVQAMAAAAAADGVRARIAWRRREGEASALGREWIEAALTREEPADALFGGGEATVTVRGGGAGGRNTEFALAAAVELARIGESRWLAGSLATDGQDALTGVAGAIGDGGTAERAAAAGVDPAAALMDNDSLAVFRAAGGIVAPGPTGTNVNDLYVALRLGAV
ncbi:MAG: MOFRL family protein, partial [Chloroflexota bacterium]